MLMLAFLLAAADPAVTSAGEHRLSQAEIDKILADAAARRQEADAEARASAAAVTSGQPILAEPRSEPIPVFGAFGVSVGSHGSRSAYGTATVGQPGRSSATISIMTSHEPSYYGYGPYYDGPYYDGPYYSPLP